MKDLKSFKKVAIITALVCLILPKTVIFGLLLGLFWTKCYDIAKDYDAHQDRTEFRCPSIVEYAMAPLFLFMYLVESCIKEDYFLIYKTFPWLKYFKNENK